MADAAPLKGAAERRVGSTPTPGTVGKQEGERVARGATKAPALPLLAIGALAGCLSGLLGVGGGIVIVPLLVAWTGFTEHQAHATSLGAIVPIAIGGATGFALDGQVDLGIAVALGVGAVVGAPLGARLMSKMSERTLRFTFGVFVLAVAVRLFLG